MNYQRENSLDLTLLFSYRQKQTPLWTELKLEAEKEKKKWIDSLLII